MKKEITLTDSIKMNERLERSVKRGNIGTGIIISFASIFTGIFFSLGCFILSEIKIGSYSWLIKGAIAIAYLAFLLWFFFLNTWTRNKVIGVYNEIKNKIEKH